VAGAAEVIHSPRRVTIAEVDSGALNQPTDIAEAVGALQASAIVGLPPLWFKLRDRRGIAWVLLRWCIVALWSAVVVRVGFYALGGESVPAVWTLLDQRVPAWQPFAVGLGVGALLGFVFRTGSSPAGVSRTDARAGLPRFSVAAAVRDVYLYDNAIDYRDHGNARAARAAVAEVRVEPGGQGVAGTECVRARIAYLMLGGEFASSSAGCWIDEPVNFADLSLPGTVCDLVLAIHLNGHVIAPEDRREDATQTHRLLRLTEIEPKEFVVHVELFGIVHGTTFGDYRFVVRREPFVADRAL
jgi:hypothetical protein